MVDPKKVEDIKKMTYPDTKDKAKGVKMIQSFLGLTGFCRRFIRGYARITKPLLELLKKDAPWNFGTEQKEAWDELSPGIC